MSNQSSCKVTFHAEDCLCCYSYLLMNYQEIFEMFELKNYNLF